MFHLVRILSARGLLFSLVETTNTTGGETSSGQNENNSRQCADLLCCIQEAIVQTVVFLTKIEICDYIFNKFEMINDLCTHRFCFDERHYN